ncbi:DUF2254 domain-containing protein [Baekduia soli]|uniref:DUF2254 domain-containing protein n=1 Tax=Baekduia soli TaxID=496014 RepID=UPI00165280CB|nr:DUF2254 domain-containing protein [Baekduia soli]
MGDRTDRSGRGRLTVVGGRARALLLNLSQNLGVIPGLIVALFAALAIGLVELDKHIDLDGVQVVFRGDGSAARTVLSVIASSLITVAGLTFSITMVVLQLAWSQFSPRLLRTFFGDRVTQVTIGTFVGTFAYSILVMRAVGSYGDAGFVPRLSVAVASLLGIGAAALLVVFLHHVSQLIQVSHVTATIARETLARTDALYPSRFGAGAEDESATELLTAWRRERAPEPVLPPRPGFVQRVGLDELARGMRGRAGQVVVLVCPGDFVSVETPLAEVWPQDGAEGWREAVLGAVTIASERDLDQDVDFGLRQLTDTALRALSPGINDPTTAVTCIGYLRAILVRLAERAPTPAVRRFDDHQMTVVARQRGFDEHCEAMLQIGRYVAGDAWVAGELLAALHGCAQAARRCGASQRQGVVDAAATTIAGQAIAQAGNERDRRRLADRLAAVLEAGALPGS